MKIYMGRGKKYFYLFNLFFALCALFCTSFTSETESELSCFLGFFSLVFPLMLQHFCTAVQQRSAPARGSFLLKL